MNVLFVIPVIEMTMEPENDRLNKEMILLLDNINKERKNDPRTIKKIKDIIQNLKQEETKEELIISLI